jgi:membrane fusion protein (multidrug efflux system)
MMNQATRRVRAKRRAVLMMVAVIAVGGGIGAWRNAEAGGAAMEAQPEPVEVVTEAVVAEREHRNTTTAIGTVLAVRSVTLRNEVPGTVRTVRLTPGQVVEEGMLLVGLDVSVEEAELKALEARARLAESTLARLQGLAARRAISAIDLDNARAERDVALAGIERTRAVIARKTIRAPFRARVGIADVHPGQFLDAGTLLTTLQGVGAAAHVDFAVAQDVAARLGAGDEVEVFTGESGARVVARILAVDARVDPATRNATVRARIERSGGLSPGASVRVRVPVGVPQRGVVVPVSALRKGPGGDHVFVLTSTGAETRAHVRQVQAGIAMAQEVMILAGLVAGERVAASGSFKLREGILVHVAGEASPVALTAR